jgi:Mitochondrial protein from FMP27/RNA pol II promoter Fmp27 protein domain/Golgi-body localisation protein domain/Domain of unknown function (DUF2405)
VVITDLKVTVDLRLLSVGRLRRSNWSRWTNGVVSSSPPESPITPKISPVSDPETETDIDGEIDDEDVLRSKTWETLTKYKERIKRLHRKINWLRMLDVVATNSSLVIEEVGSFQLANFTVAIDTRAKTVDRSRLFKHGKQPEGYVKPAEWIFTFRNLLYSPNGQEFNEILDHATLNIYGMLSRKKEGLRDASISLKFGRLMLPYDDLALCASRIQQTRKGHMSTPSRSSHREGLFDIPETPKRPGSPPDEFKRTVADSKEFVASILRGIQEVQFAVGYVGVSKQFTSIQSKGAPVYLNMSMKEVGLDLLRLDPGSPAHLTYFSRSDVAHQALVTAISLSVGIDDGHDHPERLLYIPLATATLKTTLPSKAIHMSNEKNAAVRNSNVLFANLVITSPSVDLDPKHLPITISILENWRERPRSPPRRTNHSFISRLLPKANIKVSIHEPVFRVSLPCMEVERRGTGEFDLLISAMSSMALDLESSHSPTGDTHYAVTCTYRVTSHQLYYQTASGERHNLHLADSFELKFELSASPTLAVSAAGNLQTFSLYMIRPEISEGIRQIVVHLHRDASKRRRFDVEEKQDSFLRRMPSWLNHFQIQGSDFNLEVAGIDANVSDDPKGAALHLESWTAEYKADKTEQVSSRHTRRRASNRSLQGDELIMKARSKSPGRRAVSNHTDGRRLALHAQGLEAFVIESADTWESEPFLSLPKFEVAFTSSTDAQGPVFHINSLARYIYLHYSLNRHFAVGMAATVLRKTFSRPRQDRPSTPSHARSKSEDPRPGSPNTMAKVEVTTFDFRSSLIQLKAAMPAEPNLMLQVFGMEAGQHRWAIPFATAQLVRLYAETPKIKNSWSRVVSIRGFRVDYRHSRRKHGMTISEETSADIVTEAIRVGVPHQLVVHKIFDNIVNIVKTSEQLHHRFRTGSSEYILRKGPQGPKRVPKVSLRAQNFLFEIEDSSFEWKLGLIHVHGLQEQRQRLARWEAYQLKLKRIEEMDAAVNPRRETFEQKEKRGWRRGRHKRRSSDDMTIKKRSKSAGDDVQPPKRIVSPERPSSRRIRYDTDATCRLTETAQRSMPEAEESLHKFNSRSWKKRIDQAYIFHQERMKEIQSRVWGPDKIPDGIEQRERVVAVPNRPGLMAVFIHNLAFTIGKPSFALNDYPQFLYRMGKGIPHDQKYALLIPMHVNISMGDARATLRDYPIPMVQIPGIIPGQSPRLGALSLSTDFVIAEEFRGEESMRQVRVVVVPPSQKKNSSSKGLFVDVRRTVGTVKSYSDISIEINTAAPTTITWGASYQPAIQDMMQVIESFLKPAVDPSQRVGFWDKIRLSFHSRVRVGWKSGGDVHLVLKGSRDPYHVTGSGAGFVMCWRNNVRWNISESDNPKRFMTVDSEEYILAIPDFGHFARRQLDFASSRVSQRPMIVDMYRFKKTVMKLSGKVQWLAGIVFERNIPDRGRSFEFIPHYEVVLKNPKYAKAVDGQVYDAFRGFRSHHIHLSIAIAAPVDRDWTVTNLKPSSNYNSVHLTPKFFSHFFTWWSMFSGNMSLPIRQGKLWPGVDKSSKKFGRHLATIKYNLLLSPLYLSHIYKYRGPDDQGHDCIFATGLKVKLDSFMLDLHQRREIFRKNIQGNRQTETSGVRINKAQLDFIHADFRAVSATIQETTAGDLDNASDEKISSYTDNIIKGDLSQFFIPDRDTGWVDMDDYVELDWILPMESVPQTVILPLAFAPRFTYFRQTDHHNLISGDPNRSSVFGNEDTHNCVMSARNDPRRVQCDIIQGRLEKIGEQLSRREHNIGLQELAVVRDADKSQQHRSKLETMQKNHDLLLEKRAFLEKLLKNILRRLEDHSHSNEDAGEDEFFEAREEWSSDAATDPGYGTLTDDISDFNNRFIIHNVQFKWSNPLRDIVLRYIHQVSQRRGFVYYMSRPAVKFIIDIVAEQHKARDSTSRQSERQHTEPGTPISPLTPAHTDEEVQDRIRQLLDDGKRIVEALDGDGDDKDKKPATPGGPADEISREFTAQNAYHVRMIAPQIQLQSEKNTKSAVLVTAKGMHLKVVQIMDKDRVTDDVSGLVQRRFNAAMDSLQVFVTSRRAFSKDLLDLYSANGYGAPAGSSWPPWVPLEDMYDFQIDPYGFSRVVRRTSVDLRYDKFNTLRLKYNDDITSGVFDGTSENEDERRMDHLSVNFPQLLTKCDSAQYYALAIIVLDLLLYNEPQEKTREEKLEKIMLASDFSDLSAAPGMVIKLQERIRTLQELKLLFQLHENNLNRQQWKERIMLESDLNRLEDELFFIMKAITTSQRRIEDRANQSTGMLRWELTAKELVWHMVHGVDESLIELQLKGVTYHRIDNTDGSNDNTMEIGVIEGWTLLKSADYPQLIAPYKDNVSTSLGARPQPMVRVDWYMLEAVAGIVVMDRFEVNIVPLNIQFEYETGMKLFEYIFPDVSPRDGKDAEFSPFLVKHLLPTHREENEDNTENDPMESSTELQSRLVEVPNDNLTGAGDLELRLIPTLSASDGRGLRSPKKPKAPQHSNSDLRRLRHTAPSESTDLRRLLGRKRNGSSEHLGSGSRTPAQRTNSNVSEMTKKDTDSSNRFPLLRTNSNTTSRKTPRSNDVTQMMDRASKFMTLTYVKVDSMVLCLSYKSKGSHKLPNVHDLVFRLPNLEYRNKTWSNLDLYNHLKKEITRAVLAHTTTIISNVMSRHRPSKLHQSKLRDLANASIILGSKRNDNALEVPSSSYLSTMDGIDEDDTESGYVSTSPRRGSFASGRTSQYSQYAAADEHSIVSTNSSGGPVAHSSGLRALTTITGLNSKSGAAKGSNTASSSPTGNGSVDRNHNSPAEWSAASRPKTAASMRSSRLFFGGGMSTPSNKLRRPSSAHSSSAAASSLYATPSPPNASGAAAASSSQQKVDAEDNESLLGRKQSSLRRGFSRVTRRLSGEANREREKDTGETVEDDEEDEKKDK